MWARNFKQRSSKAFGFASSKFKFGRDERNSIGTYLCLAMVLPFALGQNRTYGDSAKKVHESDETIAVYLKPASKEMINNYLQEKGIKNSKADYVSIVRHASPNEAYVYKPLYGQRAAFRLKGLIRSEQGHNVGTGRISTMVGELKEGDYEAALVCVDPPPGDSLDSVMDLPSRRMNIKGMTHDTYWKGRLPSCVVRGKKHPAITGVTFTPFPLSKQIVVEGYICSSRFVDENGNCLYDRSMDDDDVIVELDHTNEKPVEVKDILQGNNVNEEIHTEEKAECPMCRYMKAGPCRGEFIAWDECVQSADETNIQSKCFSITGDMMKCMRKHEYYDIMTAGTDFSKLDEAERLAEEHVKK